MMENSGRQTTITHILAFSVAAPCFFFQPVNLELGVTDFVES